MSGAEEAEPLGIRIRDMNVDDVPIVYRIGIKSLGMENLYHQNWSLRVIANHLENSPELCLAAEEKGTVIGFALAHRSYSKWERDLGYLEWIAVSGEHQGKRTGALLVDEMIRRYRGMGVKRVIVDIMEKQTASRSLFQGLGFKRAFSVNWFLREEP